MQAIISFFEGVGQAIITAFEFIVSLFQDLIYMITLLGEVVLNIPNYFAWLPGEIIAMLLTLIAIVVIYKILGREG